MELAAGPGQEGWGDMGLGGFTQSGPAVVDMVFGDSAMGTSSAQLTACTCCVVKPHAVGKGNLGKIVGDVLAGGFRVSAIQSFELEREATEEFLEVYKGVDPNYNKTVVQMCS